MAFADADREIIKTNKKKITQREREREKGKCGTVGTVCRYTVHTSIKMSKTCRFRKLSPMSLCILLRNDN